MILISHRGNIDCYSGHDNELEYIDKAINKGYNVEIDIRKIDNKLYLGHDIPQYEVGIDWLIKRKQYLLIHTKNIQALNYLINKDLKTFYHKDEDHVIINNCNLIWSNKISEAMSFSIIPLLSREDISNAHLYQNVFGICSDFIGTLGD